jgi:hypothetical protein
MRKHLVSTPGSAVRRDQSTVLIIASHAGRGLRCVIGRRKLPTRYFFDALQLMSDRRHRHLPVRCVA